MIQIDVIDSDIALILSRASMKRANMNLNFKEDTTSVFAETIDLVGTKIEHCFNHSIQNNTKDKQAKCCLYIYNPVDKFLTHNSGEFVNDGILRLCEPFNTKLQTKGPKSPWSSGLVEKQNLVL